MRRYWGDFKTLLPYLRQQKRLAALAISLTGFGALAALLDPLPLAFLLNSVLGDHPPPGFIADTIGTDPWDLLILVVAARVLISLVPPSLDVIGKYVSTKLDQNIALRFRSELFAHCQGLSQAYYDEKSSGDFTYRINTEARAAGAIVVSIPPLVKTFLTTTAMVIIALKVDVLLTALALGVLPLIYLATGYYAKKIEPHLVEVRNLEGLSLKLVSESIRMLSVIASFNRQGEERRRFSEQGEHAVQARLNVTLRQTLFALAVAAITALGTAVVLGVGGSHVLKGTLTVGGLVVIFSYVRSVYASLQGVAPSLAKIQQHFVDLRFARALLAERPDVTEAPDARSIGRAAGAVVFEDVEFSYPDRESTLKGISFVAPAGGTVALVGKTGAGKTTLLGLLSRFRDPSGGRILLDGIDVRELALSSLRDQIAVVEQDSLLFATTVAENIRYGRPDASDEEIRGAARAANAHDFIEQLPQGYDTWLGERGAKVSGGERQRLSIARAFLKDSPVLVLDEPTSAVDSKTESVILDALDRLMAGRTTLIVAHRLSTIRRADQILVLSAGEIVERGTHEQLMAREGVYRQMFDIQSGLREGQQADADTAVAEPAGNVGAPVRQADVRPGEGAPGLAAPSSTGSLRRWVSKARVVWRRRQRAVAERPHEEWLSPDVVLTPVCRSPTVLTPQTLQAVESLALPEPREAGGAAHPRIGGASIVVVTFDNLVFTRMCLESIIANTAGSGWELIVVDNASRDGTVEYLRALAERHPAVKPVFNQGNRGFAPANNQGLAQASGDVLVLLNNDTIVAPGWLERLGGHLADQAVGLVGPVTNHARNESRIDVRYDTYGEFLELAQQRAVDRAGQLREIGDLNMFCVAMRRDAYEQVGPLDERFEVGLFEDDDYSLRMRAHGRRVVCADDVFIHHFGQASFGKLALDGQYGTLLEANRRRFEDKWGMAWTPHEERLSSAYRRLREDVRRVVISVVPRDATVLVASRGDASLVDLDGRRAWHFPQGADGAYAGHYPADSEEAIRHVESLMQHGADFLVLPTTALWWLEHYGDFAHHLRTRHREICHEDVAVIYSLREPVRDQASNDAPRRVSSPPAKVVVRKPVARNGKGNGVPHASPPVAILGMHRSGTSMVARALNLAGVYLGDEAEFVESTPENRDGYWEHRRFLQLNEQLLEALGGGWDLPPELSPGWLEEEPVVRLKESALQLVEEFPKSLVWGWKDPRTSLTLPFWRELIPGLRVVLCVRSPLEVAQSLRRRGMFSTRLSLSLWQTYNERSLEASAAEMRVVTHYDSFFPDPTDELRRVLQSLSLDASSSTLELSRSAVKSDLRRSRSTDTALADARLAPGVVDLYARLSGEASRPPHPELTVV